MWDNQHPLSEATVIVPDEEKLHWRLVSITIRIPHDSLDLDRLGTALRYTTTGPMVALLNSSDAHTSHSRAFISTATPREADEHGRVEHIVQIDTYRFGGAGGEQGTGWLSESHFFTTLQESIHDGVDDLQVISVADLYYPAAQVGWRMKMLAYPPKLEEFHSEIGRISLSGVKLRFSDSPYGLLESFLDISPAEDEYRCSLTVLNHVSPEHLSDVRRTVLTQAEEFAQLFVEGKEES
jgi:hypothetical protein